VDFINNTITHKQTIQSKWETYLIYLLKFYTSI